ncbi:hypothetical protein ACP4OV_018353 [Aristida adscensionis]
MAEALVAPVEFGPPEPMTLGEDLLQALTAGDEARLTELLSREEQSAGLLGVTSNGNTALHLAASRGHAEVAALVCRRAPSLVAARNWGLDTPLHCAARGGHRETAACLLSTMTAAGAGEEEKAATRARNRLGATALYEAVRHQRAGVVDLLMAKAPELASVTTDDGVSPLYLAAQLGSLPMISLLLRPSPDGTPSPASSSGPQRRHQVLRDGMFSMLRHGIATIIDEVIKKCSDYFELVDHKGRNLLHCAVEHNQVQTRNVETFLTNKDGLTARDLAKLHSPGKYGYILSPRVIVSDCLRLSKARHTLHGYDKCKASEKIEDPEKFEVNIMLSTGPIGSVLIATVAFAAAFTVPGGFIADDHPGAGTAILAKRFAFRAFGLSNTMAFLCSTLATGFFVCGGGAENVSREYQIWYIGNAYFLLTLAALFIISTFAFGFQLVLGGANHALVVFVYTVCLAAVLFCFPDIWVPLQLGLVKAIWQRAGWTGRPVNVGHRPSTLLEMLTRILK